ncbi:sensor histidine kinase [Actinomadura algeriensis]|uniref:Signal transduction histidine kinase n=1 Tax=Actinomadura algeriensis TaxID=1679523 RepID=A0ABR9JRE6_9ACTN|nr:sensor histidine kinase [Actinomadura algeriensis]MBE1532966.1 signal transduction histidine kinase [Actinomadura algeriensis]
MADSRLERWGTACMVGVCLVIACPVALTQLDGERPTVGPVWLWWTLYAAFLAALVSVFVTGRVVLFVGVVGAAIGAVLLAPDVAWTAILLVFVTAIGAHLAQMRFVVVLLGVNSGVVGVAAVLRDGSWADVVLSSGIYAMLQASAVWAVLSERRNAETGERLAVANAELRAATELLAESSRSRERLRIARELHDLVGHQLTALVLELEVAAHKGDGPEKVHVERARGLARELLGDVRTAVGELRGRSVPLERALRAIVVDLPRPRVHLRVDDVGPDEACAAALIRCVQEVVTNAIRHAGAENLWVNVEREGDGVVLSARDDGCGTSVLRLGNGLAGMRERVGQLGGDVSFDTRDGFGVRVRVPS